MNRNIKNLTFLRVLTLFVAAGCCSTSYADDSPSMRAATDEDYLSADSNLECVKALVEEQIERDREKLQKNLQLLKQLDTTDSEVKSSRLQDYLIPVLTSLRFPDRNENLANKDKFLKQLEVSYWGLGQEEKWSFALWDRNNWIHHGTLRMQMTSSWEWQKHETRLKKPIETPTSEDFPDTKNPSVVDLTKWQNQETQLFGIFEQWEFKKVYYCRMSKRQDWPKSEFIFFFSLRYQAEDGDLHFWLTKIMGAN